ncbi:tetratricopeptide repeat protein [Streptomyces xanthii]|uniref:Tetratricopeptide repeat protein n=1 Tax=Streptomyces xanthii TaxID=2768069 RepID=A0A7H1BBL9_9ACTN|nr:tetratricopeptide repeat protein [Streptomyces xanthii]QNS06124.1 tetratricopeptide repeat protein [Streptomyces xanthii]
METPTGYGFFVPPQPRTPRGVDRWQRAAYHLGLLRWAASLLPDGERARADAELDASAVASTATVYDPPPALFRSCDEGLLPLFREAAGVRSCDRLLARTALDWDAWAAAHAREPFTSEQARALIARHDCPDDLTAALLVPFDLKVANRLGARFAAVPGSAVHWDGRRQWNRPRRDPVVPFRELPDRVRQLLLPHVSDLRTTLQRHLLTPDGAREVVAATHRLDRLVAAVDTAAPRHHTRVLAFWEAFGAGLREALGEDRRAWRAAAAAGRAARHEGSPGEFVEGLGAYDPAADLDLRVLAQAPPRVLADLVAALDDDALERSAARCVGPDGVRTGDVLLRHALARLERAGAAPRPPFARWAHVVRGRRGPEAAVAAWLFGQDPYRDDYLLGLARTRQDLRRALAARLPAREPTGGLAGELRAAGDAVEAQLVLDAWSAREGTATEATPWALLVAAHAARPLPEPVLWVLASRPGFPPELGEALLGDPDALAAQGPDAARLVLSRLSDPASARTWAYYSAARGLIHTVRSAGVLDDAELLAAARPASTALLYGRDQAPAVRDEDTWRTSCAELLTGAARRFGPGFWEQLAGRLPHFEGSLAELVALPRGHVPAGWGPLRRGVEEAGGAGDDHPVHGQLERFEERLRAAVVHLRPDAEDPAALGFPDRETALRWLDAETVGLLDAARVASVLRPSFAIELPRLLDRYLVSVSDRTDELAELAELAARTATRTGDRHGEAVAQGALGVALVHLRRYEEAVTANERARALMRETGDHDREGRTGRNLGAALRRLGRYTEAAEAYVRAREAFRAAAVPAREAVVTRDLARTLADLGRKEDAAAALREAIALFDGGGRTSDAAAARRELDGLTGPGGPSRPTRPTPGGR